MDIVVTVKINTVFVSVLRRTRACASSDLGGVREHQVARLV